MTVEKDSLLIGLIGSGLDGSLSPAMHEREGERQGFRYVYKRIDLAKLKVGQKSLPDLLRAAEQTGFTGLNITHPCKQEVIQYLDELSDDATNIGAVNTVLFRNGKRIGYNTDGHAFVDSFRDRLRDTKHDSIVLVGAGGAGTAIAHSLLNQLSTSLTIVDADSGRADSLSRTLCRLYGAGRARAAESLAEAIANVDGFINATPVGMEHSPGSVLPQSLIRSDFWIADIVYFPFETELLRLARASGCRVMDGGGMAVRQAAAAFTIFTGRRADVERMQEHFNILVGPGTSAHQQLAAAAE